MNEISFQATQFLPRFVSLGVLLALVWLIARFAKYLVLQATCERRDSSNMRGKLASLLANIAFWSVFIIMLPFIMNIVGFSAPWLFDVKQVLAQIFINWPVWMILSLAVAGLGFLMRHIPRFYIQAKGSFEATHREA